MNQSEIKTNTCRRRQARENAFKYVTIGFPSFYFLLVKVARDFFANHKA